MFEEKITVCTSCFSPLKGNEKICKDCGADLRNVKKSTAWGNHNNISNSVSSNSKMNYSNMPQSGINYSQNDVSHAQSKTNYTQYSANKQKQHSYSNTNNSASAYTNKNEQKINEMYKNAANNPKLTSAYDKIAQNAYTQTQKKPKKSLAGLVLVGVFVFAFASPIIENFGYFFSSIMHEITYEAPERVFLGDYSLSPTIIGQMVGQDIKDHYSTAQTIYIEQPAWYNENATYNIVEKDESSDDYYLVDDTNSYMQVAQIMEYSFFMQLPIEATHEYYSSNFIDHAYISIDNEADENFNTSMYYTDYFGEESIFDAIAEKFEMEENSAFSLQEKIEFESGAVGYAVIEQNDYDITYKIFIEQGENEYGNVLFTQMDISLEKYSSGEGSDNLYEYDLNKAVDYFKENFYIIKQ